MLTLDDKLHSGAGNAEALSDGPHSLSLCGSHPDLSNYILGDFGVVVIHPNPCATPCAPLPCHVSAIVPVRSGENMGGVAAGRVVTRMTTNHPDRDRLVIANLPRDDVSGFQFFSGPELTISATPSRGKPRPTFIRASHVNFGPKTGGGRIRIHRALLSLIVAPSVVVATRGLFKIIHHAWPDEDDIQNIRQWVQGRSDLVFVRDLEGG